MRLVESISEPSLLKALSPSPLIAADLVRSSLVLHVLRTKEYSKAFYSYDGCNKVANKISEEIRAYFLTLP